MQKRRKDEESSDEDGENGNKTNRKSSSLASGLKDIDIKDAEWMILY